jgi:hypothetical protein
VGKARVSIDGGCNPAQWLPWVGFLVRGRLG